MARTASRWTGFCLCRTYHLLRATARGLGLDVPIERIKKRAALRLVRILVVEDDSRTSQFVAKGTDLGRHTVNVLTESHDALGMGLPTAYGRM